MSHIEHQLMARWRSSEYLGVSPVYTGNAGIGDSRLIRAITGLSFQSV